MQVKLNSNIEPMLKLPTQAARPAAGAAASDQASFQQAEQLNRALAQTPEARSEAVARARELIAQSSYPPPETIDKIAALLAANMQL